jgi:HTH-type transcriptional regulator, sugar sensing transcriptional regulator
VDEDAIASLQALGFSLYEARLYFGLLVGGPQNGNELSRKTGVPSSKVYSTLERLVASGIAQHRQRRTSSEYLCVAPDELVRRLRAKYDQPLDDLENALPKLPGVSTLDLLRIVGEETVVEHARALINRAEREIYISAWSSHVDVLRDVLATAADRGVQAFTITCGVAHFGIGVSVQHSDPERVSTRVGGQMLTIVIDGESALIAHVPEHAEASGVVTAHPVLCLVAEEYLRHDLVLEKAKNMSGFKEFDRWLQRNDAVRHGRSVS